MQLRIRLGILGLALAALLSGNLLVFADEVVSPPNGKTWGDTNATSSLLNMNRDPDTIHQADPDRVPIVTKGTCTDDHGHTYEGDDDEYVQCMNQKAKARQKK